MAQNARQAMVLPADWQKFLDKVARSQPLVKRTDDTIWLHWVDLKQALIISCVPIQGLMRVIILADVCGADQVALRSALELADRVLVGSLVIHDGRLMLRHLFTEGTFSVPQLEEIFVLLRGNSTALRDHLLQNKGDSAGNLFNGAF
jgi:hypothetical protein